MRNLLTGFKHKNASFREARNTVGSSNCYVFHFHAVQRYELLITCLFHMLLSSPTLFRLFFAINRDPN